MQNNSDCPIRVARKARGLTLRKMAAEAGVHVQALYLNECGCYPTILPDILRYMVDVLGSENTEVSRAYDTFVLEKRVQFGNSHAMSDYTLGHLGEPRIHPFIAFRDSLELSRLGFAKGACVQPAVLYNVENCRCKRVPGQLIEALQDCRLPRVVIIELCLRFEEWCFE